MPTRTVETSPQRKSLETVRADLAVLLAFTIANGFPCSFGDVLGEITSSGFGRRRTRSLVTGTAFALNSPTGTVADGTLFRIDDILTNAAGANVGTILTIVGNTITLAANAAVAVATGAAVLGSDGSQVAKAIADAASDGNGNTPIDVMVSGLVKESMISGLDATAKTELGGVSTVNGVFKF